MTTVPSFMVTTLLLEVMTPPGPLFVIVELLNVTVPSLTSIVPLLAVTVPPLEFIVPLLSVTVPKLLMTV